MGYKMLHWLPNLQLKKHNQFWLKLILFSCLGHLIVLISLFWHKQTKFNLTVFAKPRVVEVVFVPLYKKVPLTNQLVSSKQIIPAKSKVTKQVLPKPAASVKTKSVKKIAPVVNTKTNTKSESVKKKSVKKDQPKKVEPKKKSPKKVDLKLKEQVVKIKSEIKAVVAQALVTTADQAIVPSEPIYIGRQDLKDLQLMTELEAILVQNWQPPVGFGTDVECQVEVTVADDGHIANLVIKKSSNILAYDLSVKRNFNGMVLPKAVFNKTFIINFKP